MDDSRSAAEDEPLPTEVEGTDLRAEGVALRTPRRTLLASIALYAPVAYAGAVVMRDSPHALPLRAALALAPLVALRGLVSRVDELPAARTSVRFALVCALIGGELAAGLGPAFGAFSRGAPLVTAASIVACTLGVALVLPSIDAIAGLGGLFQVRPARRPGLRVVLQLLWVIAGALEAASFLGTRVASIPRALGRPAAESALGVLDGLVLIATIAYVVAARRRRRLELGALERHDLMLGSATLAMPLTIILATSLDPLAASGRASVLLLAPSLALVVGALVAQLVRDPVGSAALVARAWIALIFGLVAWVTVEMWAPASPSNGAFVALVATSLGVSVGLAAPAIARRLGLPDPYIATIRGALIGARDAVGATDVHDVERGALASLRRLAGAPGPSGTGSALASPRLLTFSPLREVSIDAAGEPRARDPSPPAEGGEQDPDAPSPIARVVPASLLSLLESEPLGVVRTEVLRAFEVRRPDLRPALAWCDRNDAVAVVGLLTDGELEGLMVLPAGRDLPAGDSIGLMYARALRAIARIVAPRIALETALARAGARTRKAEHRAREADHLLERAAEREARLSAAVAGSSAPFADKVAIGGYAPAARALRAQLDALARTPAHLMMLHRPGTDPTAYAARLHRVSGRRGALHVVDAARREGIDPLRWNDPKTSPLELSRDGTLLVRAAHRLPAEVQKSIVHALAFKTGPGNDPMPLDLRVVLAVPCDDPEDDAADGTTFRAAMEPSLLGRLHEPPLRIPRLARRIEDLRAIALDRLAAAGVARQGEPLGLAEGALALLVEHPWPGDDDELDAVLVAVAARAAGVRIEAADVRACLAGAAR